MLAKIFEAVFKTKSSTKDKKVHQSSSMLNKTRPSESKPFSWGDYYVTTQNTVPEEVYTKIIRRLVTINPGRRLKILDLGTGAGVVAIAAAELGRRLTDERFAVEITAEDQNPLAGEYLLRNAKELGVDECIHFRTRALTAEVKQKVKKNTSDSDRKERSTPEKFDLITARAVLPFLNPTTTSMSEIIKKNVTQKLDAKGFAIIEFWGKKHPWRAADKSTHTEEQVREFFKGYRYVHILHADKATIALTGDLTGTDIEEITAGSDWDEITAIVMGPPDQI